MAVVALAAYAALLAVAALLVWRRPLLALELWIVGLALHNALMAALFAAGVRGAPLTAIQAWKEILLAVALARVGRDALRARRLPFRPRLVDWLALGFAVLVVVYALVPQHVLGGGAGPKTVLYGVRHDLVPVAAYLLGRSLVADGPALRRLGVLAVATAGLVAAVGILDDYLVPISWWRDSAVPRYFREQLGFAYRGTGNADPAPSLPENFIFNLGTDTHFLRRLVSVFLSPLAASYAALLGILLLAGGLLRSRRLAWAVGLLVYAALLLTYTRSALLVLPVALVLLAIFQRRVRVAALAAGALVVALAWSHAYPHVAPTGHWTRSDIVRQHAEAAKAHTQGSATGAASCGGESSFCSHWHSLKGGVHTVLDHPQGFGLGNAGATAARNGVTLKAGESTYTEVGVETGLLGGLLWLAWGLALLAGLVTAARRTSEQRALVGATAAAFAAVLALALQTDVVGDPWVAYVLWAFAGLVLTRARGATVQA
jgi:hypothetical protein